MLKNKNSEGGFKSEEEKTDTFTGVRGQINSVAHINQRRGKSESRPQVSTMYNNCGSKHNEYFKAYLWRVLVKEGSRRKERGCLNYTPSGG